MGLLPDGVGRDAVSGRSSATAAGQVHTNPTAQEWTLRRALRTVTLWLLFAMRICTPLGMMMVVPHHVVYLVGQGFDKLVAAFAFGTLGIFSFTGRTLFGVLADRIGAVPTMIFSYGMSIVGTLLLMLLQSPTQVALLWCHSA
jgi:predicted MFS family arabinose efflux permease